jgi:hypothetical protein
MNNTPNDHESSLDDRLDAMLRRNVVHPSNDFTSKTIARIRSTPDVTDEEIDDLLVEMPVGASSDFTKRTFRAAIRENTVLLFLRPMLAAAASVAVCMTGIWTMQTVDNSDAVPAMEIASADSSSSDMAEIVDLARVLDDAAPLLDSKASETLAVLASYKE